MVKNVVTDQDGRFDFGPLNDGHYTLVIDWPSKSAHSFDVELKRNLAKQTSDIKIDVTWFYPDCTGGHEFVVSSQ